MLNWNSYERINDIDAKVDNGKVKERNLGVWVWVWKNKISNWRVKLYNRTERVRDSR